jgi:hypothetical protein
MDKQVQDTLNNQAEELHRMKDLERTREAEAA